VLFACNINAVRSPMAEAMTKQLVGHEIYVDSCGVAPRPALDPFAVSVIEEIGCDLSHHHPKSFDDLVDGSFDLIISLTPEAHHRAAEYARGRAVDIVYWPTPDPTLETGNRESRLEAYRATRDRLRGLIIQRFGTRPSVGG